MGAVDKDFFVLSHSFRIFLVFNLASYSNGLFVWIKSTPETLRRCFAKALIGPKFSMPKAFAQTLVSFWCSHSTKFESGKFV